MAENDSSRGGKREAVGAKKAVGGRIAAVAAAVVIVAIVAAATWFGAFYPNIYPNVTVSGLEVGGMSVDEAEQALEAHLANRHGVVTVTFEGEERLTLDTDKLSDEYDAATEARAAAQFAFDKPREAGAIKRIGTLWSETRLEWVNTMDLSPVRPLVEELAAGLAIPVKNGEANRRGDVIDVTVGEAGRECDAAALSEEVSRRLEGGEFGSVEADGYVHAVEPKLPDLKQVLENIYVEPRDATYTVENGKVTGVTPEAIGVDFDLDAANAELAKGKDFVIAVRYTYPEVTEENLESVWFQDKLADVSTTMSGSDANRTENVRLACSSINETVLMPGDEFSYNSIVGERTAERGFRNASVYLSGGIEDQLGGGICQTSSTVYMAALRARLEITSRKNHAYTVTYCPLGEDATVYWGSLDFKFKNNRDYPIKILCWLEGSNVHVQMFGTDTDGYTVKLNTVTHSYNPYETKQVENPNLEYGKTRQKVPGHSGYSVSTYATVYDKDGNEVDSYKVSDSKYVRLDRVVEIGTKGAPSVPASGDPSMPPASAEPTTPASPVPSTPASPEPSTPVSAEPSAPATPEPPVPASAEPSAPASAEPTTPATSAPTAGPSPSATPTPTAEPSAPVSVEPSAPTTPEA